MAVLDLRLKRISSTSTYIVDDDECVDRVKSTSLENTSTLLPRDRQKDISRIEKRINRTTSSTTYSSGRKFWNCHAKPMSLYVPDDSVIQEESELITTLTKQLYKVESQMQKVQSDLRRSDEQLKAKDQEIHRLKRKVKDWETKSKTQEIQRKKEQQQRRIQTDHSEYLYRRCLMLEQRIIEMEKFLSDYGLVWVGDTNGPKCPETAIPNNTIETCYEQIIASIDQLNLAAGKGEVHVQHNERGNGASFKTPSCMSLKFYKNGMIVQDGPLRPYEDPATVSFLRDILDGYFPSELQEAYPEGVPFKVEDHRNRVFLNPADFPGQGYRLGKYQHAADTAQLTSRPRRPMTIQRAARRSSLSKDNLSAYDFSSPLMPATARSQKTKSPSEAPPMEMYVLRSQILASHNNICSDTHLQSHINAELGLSSRKDKRDMAIRSSDFETSTRDSTIKSKGVMRFPSSGRCYHSSTDRSSKLSPNRLENPEDRIRQRARSASLPNSRLSITSRSIPRTNVESPLFPTSQSQPSTTKKSQRSTKSAAPVRKNAPPILHQINEPSGRAGELRLKVRSLNGGTVYLVHVSADEPIARLYQLLDRAMARSVPRGYKIVLSGYSPRRLEQLGTTLREIGVTRDSVLHLVND
ncbi:uncharacterized protein LOC108625916 isoform X2 [Ceratina calcarata]|uniref:UBX domain-containing protein 11 n=1 Tax=Ceratina calcarata TaxID=156304 RepID=A0AAJ7J0L0_9HYME|nr:uncharacterized protein LOC108625916 isoform X2 [Ceratina calcarata]